MSTTVEFGNHTTEWSGVEHVTINYVPASPNIALTASDGATIVGTPRDMRSLAFVLLGMTDERIKPFTAPAGAAWSEADDQWLEPAPQPRKQL